MKHVFPLIYLLMISTACESVELIPAASSDLMSQVRSHKGEKAVLLNVWALWCVPCVEEFPMVMELSKEYADEAIVLFVSGDWLDQKQRALEFLEKQGVKGLSFIKNQKDNLK